MKHLHATHGPDCLWGLTEFLSYHAAGLGLAVALAFGGAVMFAQLTYNRRFW